MLRNIIDQKKIIGVRLHRGSGGGSVHDADVFLEDNLPQSESLPENLNQSCFNRNSRTNFPISEQQHCVMPRRFRSHSERAKNNHEPVKNRFTLDRNENLTTPLRSSAPDLREVSVMRRVYGHEHSDYVTPDNWVDGESGYADWGHQQDCEGNLMPALHEDSQTQTNSHRRKASSLMKYITSRRDKSTTGDGKRRSLFSKLQHTL